MKVALVYDRVNKWGGAERILGALGEIWPQAPLFTSVYNPQTAPWAKSFKITASFLQKIPGARTHHEYLAGLMPFAFESFEFDDYDVVVSVTSEAAKGIVTKPQTLHLCYCLTPTRYLWSGKEVYFDSRLKRLLATPLVKYLQKWDRVAGQRPDGLIAISGVVRERIKKYYGRESQLVYPPVDTESFRPSASGFQKKTKFFLVVSRLVKYKKVDLVIEAFNRLGWSLKIVGVGKEAKTLRKMAKNNIEFLGQLTDSELLGYYQKCQAVIFPQEEDFGIVALEAQACGKPTVAYQKGGAEETVLNGKTGLFFKKDTAEALVEILKEFNSRDFSPETCRQQAEGFSRERFKKEFKALVEKKWRSHQKTIFMP